MQVNQTVVSATYQERAGLWEPGAEAEAAFFRVRFKKLSSLLLFYPTAIKVN